MRITLRFKHQAPMVIEDVDRMVIEHDGDVYELYPQPNFHGANITLRTDGVSQAIIVVPNASNGIRFGSSK